MKIDKRIKYLIFSISTILIIASLHYFLKSSLIRNILFHSFLIPVIVSAYGFGFKGSFITSIICSIIHAPDFMLFAGVLAINYASAFIDILMFNAIAITFGFFIEKWQIEKKHFARANQNLEKINEELKEMLNIKEMLENQERLAALGTISSGIAHELRNPLSIIKTAISALSRNALLNEEIVQTKEVIIEEIKKAESVINSVLSIAKDSDFIEAQFDITLLIKDVVRLLKDTLTKKNADVIFNFEKPVIVKGDEQKLSRVFFNILLNAADSIETLSGGWIKIEISEDSKKIYINIEDSGGGIKEEHIDRIFTPFYTTKKSGTGLGLSISMNIINEHSGKILCKNTVNGALFSIILNK